MLFLSLMNSMKSTAATLILPLTPPLTPPLCYRLLHLYAKFAWKNLLFIPTCHWTFQLYYYSFKIFSLKRFISFSLVDFYAVKSCHLDIFETLETLSTLFMIACCLLLIACCFSLLSNNFCKVKIANSSSLFILLHYNPRKLRGKFNTEF